MGDVVCTGCGLVKEERCSFEEPTSHLPASALGDSLNLPPGPSVSASHYVATAVREELMDMAALMRADSMDECLISLAFRNFARLCFVFGWKEAQMLGTHQRAYLAVALGLAMHDFGLRPSSADLSFAAGVSPRRFARAEDLVSARTGGSRAEWSTHGGGQLERLCYALDVAFRTQRAAERLVALTRDWMSHVSGERFFYEVLRRLHDFLPTSHPDKAKLAPAELCRALNWTRPPREALSLPLSQMEVATLFSADLFD
ncbi:MAG: hypothetical protein F6J92_04065 [Symploca sp. SIO1A3]|nr:hypothetical protein [Symploca sp. SIO1A3]